MRICMLAIAAFAATCIAAPKERDWKTGKVADSNSARSSEVIGANTTGSADRTSSHTTLQSIHLESTQLFIVGDEYAYVVEDTKRSGGPIGLAAISAVQNRKHGCRFIVNTDVRYAQERSKLYVIDADGKECKLDIVRQEKLSSGGK